MSSVVHGVGRPRLNLTEIRSIVLPLPPIEEQKIILDSVEEQLSTVDHLESDLKAKSLNSGSLRQAILRQAFGGKLVPQDPNDEPASELLKRIAAERDARKKIKATPRKQTTKRQKREK